MDPERIETRNLVERLGRVLEDWGDNVLLVAPGPAGSDRIERRTYAEFADDVGRFSAVLGRRGVEPGDRVAILAGNSPDWVAGYMAIVHRGAVPVPVDAALEPAAAAGILADAGARRVLADADTRGMLDAALEESDEARSTVEEILRLRTLDEWWRGEAGDEGDDPCLWLEAADAEPGSLEDSPAGGDDPATVIYTSGTTGRPKGVVLTHGNVTRTLGAAVGEVHVHASDRILAVLPFHHVLGFLLTAGLPSWVGGAAVFPHSLRGEDLRHALAAGGVTVLVGVPRLWEGLEQGIRRRVEDAGAVGRRVFGLLRRISARTRAVTGWNPGRLLFGRVHDGLGGSLRLAVSGAASLETDTFEFFRDLGLPILQGYGLTETTGPVTLQREDDVRPGSVGPPLPGFDVRIHDPDAEGIGEIRVRGIGVTPGYLDNPEANAEAFDDGWFKTGDLGRQDDDGNLYITGRAKDVIVLPSGKNLYPDDLDRTYERAEHAGEVCAVGVGTGREERFVLVVVPDFDRCRAEGISDVEGIVRFDVGRIAATQPTWARPSEVRVWSSPLPRTTTQKVRRHEVRRAVEEGQGGASARGLGAAGAGVGGGAPGAPPGAGTAAADVDPAVLEQVLDAVRAVVAGGRTPPGGVRADHNLSVDLGVDSLARVDLAARLEEDTGVRLDEEDMFRCETPADVAALVEEGDPDAAERPPLTDVLRGEAEGPSVDFLERLERRRWIEAFRFFWWAGLRAIWGLNFDVRVEGRDLLPASGPFVLCPNHLSNLDGLLLNAALPADRRRLLHFLGKEELFEDPFGRFQMEVGRVLPIRETGNFLSALRTGARVLREGKAVCIFPEGARAADGRLADFRPGAGILADGVGVPVVPVALEGTWEVLDLNADAPRMWDLRRGRRRCLRVRFGPPVPIEHLRAEAGLDGPPTDDDDRMARGRAVVGAIRDHVAALLDNGGRLPDDLPVSAPVTTAARRRVGEDDRAG